MDLLLRGGRVIDPASRTDAALDVLIQEGRVARLERGLEAPAGARTLDLAGRLVVPGLVDLHVHLREPGHEHKEDVSSGSRAAAAGGFTTICAMPNTTPPNDCRAVTELILRRARQVGLVRVRPVGAITRGLAGEALAEIGEMRDAGIVAVTDDGHTLMNAEVLRRALEYARTFDLPLAQHAEDTALAAGTVMNEGVVATRAGLRGRPAASESAIIARDLELVWTTGARYHAQHISVRRSVELVRDAKRRGLPVTCEVTPHHLTLTDELCASYDTSTRVNPPLRAAEDLAVLREGLADGTIDAVATDHAPHSPVEKDLEYDRAAPGMIGLETALPLVLGLVREGVIGLPRAIELLTIGPARVYGLDVEAVGKLLPGGPADLTIIDTERTWTVERDTLRSRSKNTPLLGRSMRGGAVLTLVGGRAVHDPDRLVAP